MTTGSFENWAGDISAIGPIYPFVGSEFLLFLVCLAFWIMWHVVQLRIERQEFDSDLRRMQSKEAAQRILDRDARLESDAS